MPENSFKFDQVVHGYRDGHRLLAASLRLGVESADAMALASDLLTSRSLLPNERYISAYPLKGENKYVFACTWSAPEMSRPGCVWTHSLVFDYLTVSKIDDADLILALFRRPTTASLPTFGIPLSIDLNSFSDDRVLIEDERADDAIRRVYGMKWTNSDIVLYSFGAEHDAQTAFAIWSQMPPRLRRTTALCTESSAGRIPIDTEVTLRFSAGPVSAIPYTDNDAWRTPGTYRGMKALAKDLTRRYTTSLRKFLRRYSVDVTEPLSAIAVLAQAFLLLGDAQQPQDFFVLATFLGRAFANRRDAQLLKQDLLLGRFFRGADATYRRANAFLGTLQAIDRHQMLMTIPEDEQLINVFRDVAERPTVLAAVAELDGNIDLAELVESCVRYGLDANEPNLIAALPIGQQQAMLFARLRPQLLREGTFWLSHETIRKSLLRSEELDAESVSSFMGAFRDTLDGEELDILLERLPEAVMSNVAAFWKQGLLSPDVSRLAVQRLAHWADLLPRAIREACALPRALWAEVGRTLISRHDAPVEGIVWAQVIKDCQPSRLEHHESSFAVLLFVEGIKNQADITRSLLRVSFDPLYVVAWNGRLTLDEQQVLDERLPGSSTYWSWDYCRRLTRACLNVLMRAESWDVSLLKMDVSALAVEGIVREIAAQDDSLSMLRALSGKIDEVPNARRKWGKALNDAIKHKSHFWPWSW